MYIWLNLVKDVNINAYTTSKAFDSWLDSKYIVGGSIKGKEILYIEFTSAYEVEEVLDSEDNNNNDDNEDNNSSYS